VAWLEEQLQHGLGVNECIKQKIPARIACLRQEPCMCVLMLHYVWMSTTCVVCFNSFSLCFYRGSTPSGGVACYFSPFIQLLTLPQRSQRHQRFETKNTIMLCIMYQWIVIVCVCYEWKLHVDLVCSEYVCGIRRSLLDTPIRYRLMACKINS